MKVYTDRFISFISINNLVITIVFIATRAWLLSSGLKPDFEQILIHYQYLDTELLSENLASSLFYLHSQPPLWNAVIGLLLTISNNDPALFIPLYLAFSFALSLAISFMLDNLVSRLTGSNLTALGISLFYVIFSSAYYYEVYIFYPLFTAFLATGCVYGAMLVFSPKGNESPLPGLFIMLACLISLTLTWSLFHPVIVIFICIFLFFRIKLRQSSLKHKEAFLIRTMLIISILAAFVVPVKNLILFGYFGASTWGGMNLAQVAPRSAENTYLLHQCSDFHPASYREYQLALEMVQPGAGYHAATMEVFKSDQVNPNLNNIGLIQRSTKCAGIAMEEILANLPGYAAGRWDQFVHTAFVPSDSYYYSPSGYRGSAVEQFIRIRNFAYLPYRDVYFVPIITLASIVLAPALLFLNRKSLPMGSSEVVFLVIFLSLWVVSVGYLVNGYEQNRMRFTVEPLLFFLVVFLAHRLITPKSKE